MFKVDIIKDINGEIDLSTVVYRSPKVIDKEGDSIKMNFDLKGKKYLSAK